MGGTARLRRPQRIGTADGDGFVARGGLSGRRGVGDEGGNGVLAETKGAGTVDERAHLPRELHEGGSEPGDDGAAAAAQVDEPLVSQLLVGTKHGVNVNVERAGEPLRRRQRRPLAEPPGRNVSPHGVRDLLIDGALVRLVDSDEHGTSLLIILVELELVCEGVITPVRLAWTAEATMHTVVRPLTIMTAAVAAAALLAGCAPEPDDAPAPATTSEPAPPAATPPTAQPLGPREPSIGLQAPWSVAFAENSALVSERDSGRLLELTADGGSRQITVVEGVQHGGEGGLLGIAVPPTPEGSIPEQLFVYSTAADGNRVQRFALTGAAGELGVSDPVTVIDGLPSALSHNGGRIAFGPDGMLYVTVGDAGQSWLSQDLESLGGKILRLTPEGDVPSDNPFEGSPVYSYGHRNPQGIAWAEDGTMYSSEFGQDTWDELNVITAGANYGWPEVEGIAGDERYVDPVQQWQPADASPSGIAITRDTIFIANLRGQRVRTVPLDDLTAASEHFVGEYGRIRDVSVAPDGTLWLLSNNTDGRVEPRHDDDRFIDTGLVPQSRP